MRTRATGHSPGGFHVLASPKRVRRQPPPPIRAQPTSISISERPKEQKSENGKVDDHQSSYQLDNSLKGFSESEIQPHNSQSKESISRSSSSNNGTRRSQTQQVKVNAIKTREGLLKKIKSNRGSSKRHIKDDYAVKDVVTVEIGPSTRSRDISPGRVKSVLGKRTRDTSSGALDLSRNGNELSNHKRARTNIKDQNRSSLLSLQNLATKNPPPQFDESANDNRFSNSKSVQHISRETRTDSKISPKSMILYRARPPNSSPNYSSGNLYSEKKNDAETQLKQGMQSIMSRMNKYQYQPLPKNPYDSLIASASASQDDNSQGTLNKKSNPKSPTFIAKKGNHSRGESYPANLSESEKDPTEYAIWDRKRVITDQDFEKRRQKMDNLEKLKDRRIEVEKLFRTTAPDASYQNILRAVAEWAVHNSSTLPTKDEIFTYVESSKAPDATELFSSSDRLFPRRNHSKIRKVSKESSASLTTPRTKSTRSRNDVEHSQNHGSMLPNSYSDHGFSTRRVTFDKSTKTHQAESDSSSFPEEYGNSSPSMETPSTSKAQQPKSIASQSWGLVTSFKNLVSTPFKVLGFGLGSNTQEAVKSVTKDIDFEYKAPTTPITSGRSAKGDRKVINNRNVYRTPIRSTGKHTGRSINRTSNDKLVSRGAVTEKRMADLQRELDFKKSQGRERESRDDTNLRRKKPNRPLEDTTENKFESTPTRQSNHLTSRAEGIFEEWPPNLDSNRPVVELTQAAQILPRGPNGEDVAAMLCSGWLISKHRDSFIRESGRRKLIPAPIKRSIFGSSNVAFSTQNQEPNTYDVIKLTENMVRDTEDSTKPNDSNQPGRSYGFKYDDDSSSDDEAKIDENIPSQSDSKNSNFNKTNVTPQISFSSGTSNSFNDSRNQSKPIQVSDTTVRRLPPTPSTPYTPRLPSTLRNVEALSPYSSKLTTPMSEQNHIASPSRTSGDMSLVLYDHDNTLTESSDNHEDWSYVFDLDPQMMDLDPKVIDAVETLSKNSLPCVELPAVVEELSTST
ncbi:putative gpi-anchored cell surface glycoprotein [Erysiphe neolycopersici]|uniref:Putative gpi-anchored cell surface glycoprotein n=1 Tax=Erysiphe neolycopersici TaxID=212602 RepID=A0A420HXN7_9PEZI|nr:putative gpi-anchored cell surface glycoprotein [Erysiphe neolycopersici]